MRSTRQLADRLRDIGADVTVRFYPHVSHLALIGAVIPVLQWMAPLLDDVAAFVCDEKRRRAAPRRGEAAEVIRS